MDEFEFSSDFYVLYFSVVWYIDITDFKILKYIKNIFKILK